MLPAEKIQVPADYIDVTVGVCGGKPHIRGARVKVSEIAWRHVYDGQSADEIAEALPQLSLAQVHAALAYYHERREQVEAELRAEDELVLSLARRYAPHLVSG